MNLPKLAQYLEQNNYEAFLILKEYQASQDAKLDKVTRELAHERLRADQGWQRWESANADRNQLRRELAAIKLAAVKQLEKAE